MKTNIITFIWGTKYYFDIIESNSVARKIEKYCKR